MGFLCDLLWKTSRLEMTERAAKHRMAGTRDYSVEEEGRPARPRDRHRRHALQEGAGATSRRRLLRASPKRFNDQRGLAGHVGAVPKLIDGLMTEHADHGGVENGNLMAP